MARRKAPRRSDKLALRVCNMIADGMSLRQIARAVGYADATSITQWCREDENFHTQYARAKEIQADRFAEEIIEISDDASNDWIEREIGAGVFIQVPNHEHINRSRLRVDARKWLMAKMAPKKYGDKLIVEPQNGTIDLSELSAAELDARDRELADQERAVADRQRALEAKVPGASLKLVSGSTKAA